MAKKVNDINDLEEVWAWIKRRVRDAPPADLLMLLRQVVELAYWEAQYAAYVCMDEAPGGELGMDITDGRKTCMCLARESRQRFIQATKAGSVDIGA